MASLFLLIAAIVARRAGVGPLWTPAELGEGVVALAALAGTIGAALLGATLGLLPWNRPRAAGHAAWSRSARRTRWIGTVACLWLAACVLLLGWLDLVRERVGDLVLIDEAVAISPALIAMVMAWWLHSAHARVSASMASRVEFVVSQGRTNLPLFLVPVALVLGSQELVDRLLPAGRAITEAISFAVALMALLLSPALVVPLLSTAPLPPRGDLAQRIASIFTDRGIRVRGIRLWRTGGMLMNGLALGVLPFCRWVLLSDALVANLTDEETLAVTGHEAAHLKHHHAAWLVGCVMGGAGCAGVAVGSLLEWCAPVLPAEAWIEWSAVAIVAMLVIIFFGAVSRTCERQADADAARSLSPAATIAPEAVGAMRRALAVVAFANGIPPNRPSFRHGSIASRRRRLERLAGRPKASLPIDRRMRVMQWLIMAALLVTALSLIVPAPQALPSEQAPHRMIRHTERP